MEMLGQELIQIHDLAFEPYLSAEQIALRVGELGTAIRAEYADRHPIFVSVLNGAFIFAADLVRAAAVDCETAFTRLSSYEGTSSTGVVRSTLGLHQ
ncbi:MAG: phosphoribosyltransferase family protein [Bacteroidota bacterium]